MRLTYTDLENNFLDGTGNSGSSDTTLVAFFKRKLGERYQLAEAQIANWTGQIPKTASTAVNQQFYHYPPGVVNIETIVVTIGSINYPLTPVDSQLDWDRLNAVLFTGAAIPVVFFARRDDFGIWPIPQGIYTMTLNYVYRDRNLTNADYTTGTVTVTNGSQTLTGSGTTFSAAMVNRWFQDTNDGYWYRISAYNSATSLTLEEAYQGTTASGEPYRIGETPELPEESHTLLSTGAIADYYSDYRADIGRATWFNNVFWTGDGQNSDRTGRNIRGGLIGIQKRYAERSNSKIVRRNNKDRLANTKIFATTISA